MRNFLSVYRNICLSRNILWLYLNRMLVQTGTAAIGAFGVIFFYEQFGNSIEKLLLLFIALYFIFLFLPHIGAKPIHKLGMRNMMILSTFFLLGTTVARIFWEVNVPFFLVLFVVSISIYKALYWVPYHVEFAAFTTKGYRGKQHATLSNASSFIAAFLPAIAGFIIFTFDYDTLFIISGAISTLSFIPLLFVVETKEQYTWSAKKLLKQLFKKDNRSLVLANIADGFQNVVSVVIWPVFVFILLDGDYISVGVIASLVILTLILIRFLVGAFIDKLGPGNILRAGSFFSATGWIAKLFVDSGFSIFVSDTYHNFGRLVNRESFQVSVYDQAADNEHYIDEYTVLKETALMIGKFLMLVTAFFVIAFWGIKATFVIAAVAMLFMNLISKTRATITE